MHAFARNLLAWYEHQGRYLPWRGLTDPYPIWLSEIMLQQTQVATVQPYYHRFLERFPDLKALAEASQDEVLALWAGLGYYTRARNLHAAARRIQEGHGGVFPRSYEEVVALPGIGPSTAGAILSLAFNQTHPILDGNVKRVLSRLDAIREPPGKAATERRLWQRARELTPQERPRDYNQALMDLGATVCTRANPSCSQCPVQHHCRAYAEGAVRELPIRPNRKSKPVRAAWLALVESRSGFLLERRPPTGFWGGLWCPPLVERSEGDPREVETALSRRLGGHFRARFQEEPFRHTFSHFYLALYPLRLSWWHSGVAEADLIWAASEDRARLGLPAAVTPLLKYPP